MMKGVNINPIILVRNILAYDNKAPFLVDSFIDLCNFQHLTYLIKKNFCVNNGMAEFRKANMETIPPTNPYIP